MKKTKSYYGVKFSSEKIKEVFKKWSELGALDKEIKSDTRKISFSDHSWNYDNDSEFFADFSKDYYFASFSKSKYYETISYSIELTTFPKNETTVSITAPSRAEIEELFYYIDKDWEQFKLPVVLVEQKVIETPEPAIFIGHGKSKQWRDLKDHLTDKHGYKIVAYETGARSGHTIRDILDDMMNESSFAILVMTGEDELKNGTFIARPNVIHEIGLFQGRLGFSKAIVLLEEHSEEFSNLSGIQQIRYSKGNIKETFGDILATIKREFK